jgi:quinol monooxygenase YgiN
MIHVVATIRVRAGRREAFLAELSALVPQVLAETGCVEYAPTLDVPDSVHARQVPARPDAVVIVEKWRTLDDLRAHLAAPHMAAYRDRVKDLVVGTELVITRSV